MNKSEMPIITNIFWKRTYLFIEYFSIKPIQISIAMIDKKKYKILKEHILETKKIGDNKYRCKINITIAEGRNLLFPGEWRIIINNNFFIRYNISNELMNNIENLSRVFRYCHDLYAYVLTFKLNISCIENNEYIYISFLSSYMNQSIKNGKIILLKKVKIKLISFLKFLLNMYYQIITHFTPKTGKRILFMSENRIKIMDNLEAIDKRIKERKLDKKFKISYSFRNIFDKKRQNPFEWLKVLTKIAKSDYIFVDDYVPIFSFLNLNKKTKLIQTWHAGFGFKLVGYGRFGIEGSPRPTTSCHRKYTYGLIGNENLKEIYSEVWGIEKDALLPTGMPRLDNFLDKKIINEKKEHFYKSYPQLKNKKIITFAPTYRGSSQKNAYYDYDKIDFDKLYEFCKKTNSVITFGKHHFIKQNIPIKKEYKDLIYDMSEYKLNDLFYVTDVLVTDYSSCFYDFLLLNKPVLFYVYDKTIYSATRGVHRPIDDVAPGKVCETFEELLKSLYNKDYSQKEKIDFLVDNCVKNKKTASDQVIDFILLGKRNEDICNK